MFFVTEKYIYSKYFESTRIEVTFANIKKNRMAKEKDSRVHKLVKIDKELFDAVVEAAKRDKRNVNDEIQILLSEALEARKNTEK